MDSTVMEEPMQQEDQVKETRDEILNEPRRSEAERAPEPVTEILNGMESHVRVLDWLEKALPEAAGPEAQENPRREVEAEAEAEMEAEAPSREGGGTCPHIRGMGLGGMEVFSRPGPAWRITKR